MSGRCRHRLVIYHGWHRTDGYWYEAPYLARRQADAAVCQTCHAWLPLGHSDETPERVAVEIRAAEQALKYDSSPVAYQWNYIDETHCNCWFEGDAECCRCGFEGDIETPCEVGYLAACIATHEENP